MHTVADSPVLAAPSIRSLAHERMAGSGNGSHTDTIKRKEGPFSHAGGGFSRFYFPGDEFWSQWPSCCRQPYDKAEVRTVEWRGRNPWPLGHYRRKDCIARRQLVWLWTSRYTQQKTPSPLPQLSVPSPCGFWDWGLQHEALPFPAPPPAAACGTSRTPCVPWLPAECHCARWCSGRSPRPLCQNKEKA